MTETGNGAPKKISTEFSRGEVRNIAFKLENKFGKEDRGALLKAAFDAIRANRTETSTENVGDANAPELSEENRAAVEQTVQDMLNEPSIQAEIQAEAASEQKSDYHAAQDKWAAAVREYLEEEARKQQEIDAASVGNPELKSEIDAAAAEKARLKAEIDAAARN